MDSNVAIVIDSKQSLTKQLDKARPNEAPCSETALYDMVAEELLMPLDDYGGLEAIRAMARSKINYCLDHPESYSLGDLSKISAPNKKKVEVEASNSLLSLFMTLDERPQEVVDTTVHEHGAKK